MNKDGIERRITAAKEKPQPNRKFLCQYEDYKYEAFGFEIYAHSFEDAERRLKMLKSNASVTGMHIEDIPYE